VPWRRPTCLLRECAVIYNPQAARRVRRDMVPLHVSAAVLACLALPRCLSDAIGGVAHNLASMIARDGGGVGYVIKKVS